MTNMVPDHGDKVDVGNAYTALPHADPPCARRETGGSWWRRAMVSTALLSCLLNSGLVFGYSALLPVLVSDGAFAEACVGKLRLPCSDQLSSLTGMFTLTTSALNVTSILSGAVLDYAGPKFTAAGAALLVAVGCALFSCGGPGLLQLAYVGGFLLMGVMGPIIFISTLSFANLFPNCSGTITAALVGCFDASSLVFFGVAAATRSGAPLAQAFRAYAAVPLLTMLCVLAYWPTEQIKARISLGSVGTGWSERELRNLPVVQKLVSSQYLLLLHAVSVGMVCINFFIATCDLQLDLVDGASSPDLKDAFGLMLPLGGIVCVPLVGWLLEAWGPATGWFVFQGVMLASMILNVAYATCGHVALQYASFVAFVFCRPFFYAVIASFTGEYFGFSNFGIVYGLVNTVAGVFNCAVQPLLLLAHRYGFAAVNLGLMVAVASTVALPSLILRQARSSRARRRHDSDGSSYGVYGYAQQLMGAPQSPPPSLPSSTSSYHAEEI